MSSMANSRVKPKAKSAAKPKVKSKIMSMAKPKALAKSKAKVMTKTKVIMKKTAVKTASPIPNLAVKEMPPVIKRDVRALSKAPAAKSAGPIVKRIVNQMVERRRPVKRPTRVNQFSFMKAPGIEHAFEVGGGVEVFCDHEKNKERIRGWVKGIVVQVDNKMVAVQFRSNVYLTDGWMVPDRILWFPLNSEHMRLIPGKKPVTKDLIPDY
jgi:hypothetical protein